MASALYTPAVQGWLLRKAIARQPGWRVNFEKFGVSLQGLESRGLDFAMPGLTARSAPLNIRILPSRLLRGELHLAEIEVKQLRIELTPDLLPKDKTPAPAAPFAGALALLRVPLPWIVQAAAIDAEFVVNESGHALVVGRLSLRGGGLSAQKPGEFTWEFSAGPNPATSVTSRGTLRLEQDAQHGLARVELRGDFTPPPLGALTLPPGKFELVVTASPTGENYSAAIRFAREGSLTFSGRLDAAHHRLTGVINFQVESVLARGLAERLPLAALNGKIDLVLDLKNHDLDATLGADVTARDWTRVLPQLSAVDALAGHLDATLTVRAGRPELRTAGFALRGATSPLTLDATLTAPLALSAAAPVTQVRLALAHLPIAWANPFLRSTLQLSHGEISGEWSLTLDAARTARLATTRPIETGPITLTGDLLPPLPGLTLHFSPHFELSPTRVAFECTDLAITSTEGDRVTLTVAASHELATQSTRLTGALAGALPSLFASADRALPFTLGARWAATQATGILKVDTLEFSARHPDQPEPALSLALLEPIQFGSADELSRQRDRDLLTLRIHKLPLAWISRWLSPHELTGAWTTGESALRRAPEGQGFVFVTRDPWRFERLGIALGGRTLFTGRARLAPEVAIGVGHSTVRLRDLELVDTSAAGNRLAGETTLDWHEPEKKFSVDLALDASLLALPGSADTFGPLTARLRTHASSIASTDSQITRLQFEVSQPSGPLLTLGAAEPFRFAAQPNGEILFTSTTPLALTVARIPLAWLRPWLPADTTVEGILEPAKLELRATPRSFSFRAAQPVSVTGFSYSSYGLPRVQAANGTFSPGAELTLTHQLKPTFQLSYSGQVRAAAGALDVAGARAITFDSALGFSGDDRNLRPARVDTETRVDFAALHRIPLLAANGMPPAGEFTFGFHGDFHGQEAPVFKARFAGVPTTNGHRILPSLDFDGRGQLGGDGRSIRFAVATRFATTPRPSDASFNLDVAFGQREQRFSSALRSTFFDVGELIALADAFTPKESRAEFSPPPKPSLPPPNPTPPAPTLPLANAPLPSPLVATTPLGVPFWGDVRGRFDLELGTVLLTPYRIDGVRGRIELTDRAFSLSDFSGEMFSGRWSGALRLDYDPAAANNDHALTSRFQISQMATAAAIAAAMPNDYGSLDTRLDLDLSLRGTGNRWWELLDHAEGEFTVDARSGIARLTHPQLGTAATVLALAGTLSFSSEMRALGRLLSKFAAMPVERLHISGARDAAGDLVLREFRLDSPQAHFLGQGRVPATAGVPLAARRLDLSVQLTAKDEMAVILGNMKLLERTPQPDGFRRMTQPFTLGGEVGKPDPSQLYEMFARAVDGSSGTWSLIMHKVRREMEKSSPPSAGSPPAQP